MQHYRDYVMRMHSGAVILAVIGIIAVWVACLIPLQQGGGFEYKDKFEHMVAYLLQVLALAILFPQHRWRVVAWFLFQGAVIEGLQLLTSYRSGELADMAANTVGILLGLGLSFTPLAQRLARRLRSGPLQS